MIITRRLTIVKEILKNEGIGYRILNEKQNSIKLILFEDEKKYINKLVFRFYETEGLIKRRTYKEINLLKKWNKEGLND